MGKLYHIDLNDQIPGRYDQDLRFGSANPKAAFFLVKFLEDVGYGGSRHFDAHAYRTSDYEDVKAFARGCMRTYLILKEKAERWNADPEIQELVGRITAEDETVAGLLGPYTPERVRGLQELDMDRRAVAARGQPYERLDQLTVELLLGAR
jgi:xylose isomerase